MICGENVLQERRRLAEKVAARCAADDEAGGGISRKMLGGCYVDLYVDVDVKGGYSVDLFCFRDHY